MTTKQPSVSEMIAAMEKAEKTQGIVVIPELQDLLPKLEQRTYDELLASIKTEGIRDPILLWKEQKAVIDGHNRYEIARLLNVSFDTKEMSFPDIHAVKRWIVINQLSRRNLTPKEFDYFLGTLYNESKQEGAKIDQGGKTTAEVIAEAHGVSPKKVRREAEVVKGIDKITQVRGKLAKAEILTGKSDLTKDELTEIGKAPNATVAGAALKKIEQIKATVTAKKKANVQTTKTLAAAPTLYKVALCRPDFANNYNEATEPRPPLDKEAIVYVMVPDEHLGDAMSLLKRWGLTYEASIVYATPDNYGGVFTKITHSFLLVATKGTVAGPKKANMLNSVQTLPKETDAIDSVFKLIASYSPDGTRIDMRTKAKGKSPHGWDNVK